MQTIESSNILPWTNGIGPIQLIHKYIWICMSVNFERFNLLLIVNARTYIHIYFFSLSKLDYIFVEAQLHYNLFTNINTHTHAVYSIWAVLFSLANWHLYHKQRTKIVLIRSNSLNLYIRFTKNGKYFCK